MTGKKAATGGFPYTFEREKKKQQKKGERRTLHVSKVMH